MWVITSDMDIMVASRVMLMTISLLTSFRRTTTSGVVLWMMSMKVRALITWHVLYSILMYRKEKWKRFFSMKQKSLERLIGKHVKIVSKEPGDERTRIVTGKVTDVDLDGGFIMIETCDGECCLSVQVIVAMKLRTKKTDMTS